MQYLDQFKGNQPLPNKKSSQNQGGLTGVHPPPPIQNSGGGWLRPHNPPCLAPMQLLNVLSD